MATEYVMFVDAQDALASFFIGPEILVNHFLDAPAEEQQRITGSMRRRDGSLTPVARQIQTANPELFESLFRLSLETRADSSAADPSNKRTSLEAAQSQQSKKTHEVIVIDDAEPTGDERSTHQHEGSLHGGIENAGNTCYAAALLQALDALGRCAFDDSEVGIALRACIGKLQKRLIESPLVREEVQTLIETQLRHGWNRNIGAFGDPYELMQFIQQHLSEKPQWLVHSMPRDTDTHVDASIVQVMKWVPDGTSMQSILSGTYVGARQRFASLEDGKTGYFSLTLDGRVGNLSGDGEFDRRRIALSPHVFLPCKDPEKQQFSLSSVVMYESQHYYLLKPRFDSSGSLKDWICFNDSRVSEKPNTRSPKHVHS